ncbi:MAG TPA: thiamine pyrophosphate-dependent enzyme, partial [Rhodothermales bacterium]|nr:thiamine pyrophosphate-dependent enzyme [Rhodothermales bacterium]
ALIANATGCSSIYGGNLPTTPWTKNRDGRGPAWSNSLFEDNAEFGLGMRLALDKQGEYARELLEKYRGQIGHEFVEALLNEPQETQQQIDIARVIVHELKQYVSQISEPWALDLTSLADRLVRKNVWIIGGDGWAYDIGYGGLDHVLASGKNVNVVVLDTEVYSNTGGQASKSTGLGAVAKFAAGGKATPKKELGLLAMNYGYVYVAQIASGANENQAIKAFQEAESYDGPSLIIAYSQCIAHGIDMAKGMEQQQLAVESGHWPLYRFDPRRIESGKPPLQLDSKAPTVPLKDYLYNENRYRVLTHINADAAAKFLKLATEGVKTRWKKLEQMAGEAVPSGDGAPAGDGAGEARKPKMPPGFKPKMAPVKPSSTE